MIDFPASPTLGQTFTAAGVTWTWDGTKWTATGASVAYLPLTGGTLTGPVVLAADPTANLQAATKQYADAGVSAAVAAIRYGDNRVINGDMRINQRGVTNSAAGGYTVDRWQCTVTQPNKGSWIANTQTNLPGFYSSLGFQSSSAYALLATDAFQFFQTVEADMVSDFAWGSSAAQPVTLSFWVLTSLTGTFSGSIRNYAATRSYPFTYSIPVASTWTKIVVTIPGDTAGTWVLNGNGGSFYVTFDLGTGTTYRGPANAWVSANYIGVPGAQSIVAVNGASLFVTGVKLEIGSVATPYNRQSLAKSLADCQRYYSIGTVYFIGSANSGFGIGGSAFFPVTMRANPTVTPSRSGVINLSNFTSNYLGLNSLYDFGLMTANGQGQYSLNWTASAEL